MDMSKDNTETESGMSVDNPSDGNPEKLFKKPAFLVGPMKGKIKKVKQVPQNEETVDQEISDNSNTESKNSGEASIKDTKSENDKVDITPCPYKEPAWASIPTKEYKVEILKSGVILECIDLSTKSFHVIGRLLTSDISLAHPSISRFHAILQYGTYNNEEGLYLCDLGSTHGTFWNGSKVKTNMYIKLHGGHMLTFGGSKRKFIIVTPPEDEEPESAYTVTELKEMRKLELEEREKEAKLEKLRLEDEERKREEEGIDWGMGEDAEDEPDLEDNPYAQTENHDLYLNDPKKTLRGWFEREGYELHYEVEEKSPGQFLCYVDLPITDAKGRDLRAEALVRGKKKESVIQCAMEACRILDLHGYLRQSHHESRKKRKSNNQDDYFDSDDDDFLDRTGSVEKKRNKKLAKNTDSLSLAEKYTTVTDQIKQMEKMLNKSKRRTMREQSLANVDDDDDELDSFMSELNKNETVKMEMDLKKLNEEKVQLEKLLNDMKT